MSGNWSLPDLLDSLNGEIERTLTTARKAIGHAPSKGDASEAAWLDMLRTYLPERYQSAKAFVVDSDGNFSEQIDVVVFDRQYSPFIFNFHGQAVLPVESVYAVFEAKQTINGQNVSYAREKVGSVRKLTQTSLPIPHAGGVHAAKAPISILGGILTLDSDWTPALGRPLVDALNDKGTSGTLDMGCVARHGTFWSNPSDNSVILTDQKMPATAFLFELIARLQSAGTVPMIDIRAYAKWLKG